MKKISMILCCFLFVFVFGCPAKKENKEASPILLTEQEAERRCLIEKIGKYCYSLADIYVNKKDRKRFADRDKFIRWAELGCEYKDSSSCYGLYLLWDTGNGIKEDIDKDLAYKYARKGCDLFEEKNAELMADLSYENYVHVESAQNSCNALATFFYGTDDSKYQNFEKAMELAKRICLGDVPIWGSCYRVARLYSQMGDMDSSLEWHEHGCDYRLEPEWLSCLYLLRKYYFEGDEEKTDYYYKRFIEIPISIERHANLYYIKAMNIWLVKKDAEYTFRILFYGLEKEYFDLERIENDEVFKDFLETEEYKKLVEEYKNR